MSEGIAMTAQEKIGMPLDEFIHETNEQMFELINGERIPRLPTITRHNDTIDRLYMALKMGAELKGLGIVRPEATFVLPDHYDSNWVIGSRTPDLLFIAEERLAAYRQANPNWRDTPYLIVPDLVIEVISPTDTVSKLDEKVDAYLADGVRLIVVLDPERRKAVVHNPDAEQPLHLSGDATLDLSDVIPGFQIPLPKLFE
jgi:Uma2 family endonuclease